MLQVAGMPSMLRAAQGCVALRARGGERTRRRWKHSEARAGPRGFVAPGEP